MQRNQLKSFFYGYRNSPCTREFDAEIVKTNLRFNVFVLPVIAAIELYNMIYVLAFTELKLSTQRNCSYFALYAILFVASVAAVGVRLWAKRQREPQAKVVQLTGFLYTAVICLWGVAISLLDLQGDQFFGVYMTVVLGTSVMVYLRPWQFLLLYLSTFILSIVGVAIVQGTALNESYLNIVVAVLTSICVALTRYQSKYEDTRKRCVIREQTRQIEEMNSLLKRQVITDEMTGLYNRRFLDVMMPSKCGESNSFAAIMLDIDDFKMYNDQYGHQAGDRCLVALAALLRERVSSYENWFPIRYGGEEFCLIGLDAEPAQVENLAEELRRSVEMLHIADGMESLYQKVTISAGVCLSPDSHCEEMSLCLHKADQALYRAKYSGKNRVALYSPGGDAGVLRQEPGGDE